VGIAISALRDASQFTATIAERGWHEWWIDSTTTLAEYRSGIEQMATAVTIPCALVAHRGEQYVGSVLLVDDDLESRQELTPWIAALWVEPEFRRHGIAFELIQAARNEAAGQGYDICYLCATPSNSPYYFARGFHLLESDVEGLNVFRI
jgi:GNAT superfamily N-acetyltransferase